MAKVRLIESRGTAEGNCLYSTHVISTTSRCWYTQDRLQYNIGRVSLDCTPWGEILSVYALVPRTTWTRTTHIDRPTVLPSRGLAIDEHFDPVGRIGGEESVYNMAWSPRQSAVVVQFGDVLNKPTIFVSPHRGLVLGAADVGTLTLSQLLFFDVDGLLEA